SKSVHDLDRQHEHSANNEEMSDDGSPEFWITAPRPEPENKECNQDRQENDHRELREESQHGDEACFNGAGSRWRLSIPVESDKEEQVHQRRRNICVHHSSMTENGWLQAVQENREDSSNRAEPTASGDEQENSQRNGESHHRRSCPKENLLKGALIDAPEMAVELPATLREITRRACWAFIVRQKKDEG